MKKNILTLLYLSSILSIWGDTLVFKNGQQQPVQNVQLNQTQITTNLGQTIPISSLRGLIVDKKPTLEMDLNNVTRLRTLAQNIKVMEDKRDRILIKKQTYIYNKDKCWSEEFETIQYINAASSNQFELKLKFNSNYENVKICSLFYTTASGDVKPLPEESITIFSRSKENPQLKTLAIKTPKFKDNVLIMVRTLKEQYQVGPVHRLSLDCRLSEKLPVEYSEVNLDIAKGNKIHAIQFNVSDPKVTVDYNIVKTVDYTSRQWITQNIEAESKLAPLVLSITTIKHPRTIEISSYNKKLQEKIEALSTTTYLKQFPKIKNLDLFFKKIRTEFKITHSNMALLKQTDENLIKTKTGTVEDLSALILAILEFNKYRPELYLLEQDSAPMQDHKIVIKIDDQLYFLHQDIDRSLDWVGYCYYGYNIGNEIDIPALHQENQNVVMELKVNPTKNGSPGSLDFSIDHHFTLKELKELDQYFPGVQVTTSENRSVIHLPNRTQLITDQLLSFNIPNLDDVVNAMTDKTNVIINVTLPRNWRVHNLPVDNHDGASYMPSIDGFVVKTVLDKDSRIYQTPILLKRISDEKKWFE